MERYRREQEALLNAGALNRDEGYTSDHQSRRSSQLARPPPPTRPIKAASSFHPPTSHTQHMSMSSKRPSGVRLGSEPQGVPVQVPSQEAPRGKKGLPFLKNPMSTLLLRRKSSQNIVPDLSLSLRNEKEEPTYDPRIRGTRVHDFSAPRPRKPVRVHDMAQTATEKPSQDTLPSVSTSEPTSAVTSAVTLAMTSVVSDAPPAPPPKDDHALSKRASSSGPSQETSADTTATQQRPHNIPSRRSTTISEKRRSLLSSRRKSSIPASLVSMSRNTSGASGKGILSSIPKHMKSTSSRFSFDMVGAANEEKLLEERHRQRQQDKQVGEEDDFYQRDSRFDDFDEEAFDYDGMDYDDGLEERIPGVNADYEEEEDFQMDNDPDNDQENFAGFVFQRSDPPSTLTTPRSAGLLPTPRDANGDVIGYAATGYASTETGETPDFQQDDQTPTETSCVPAPLRSPRISTGLGIQGLVDENEATHQVDQVDQVHPMEQQPPAERVLDKQDELYFDDGLMHEFDGEGDGSTFDESIFDLDDTDQYGRPIPGMFARVLSQRNAAQETKNRESEMTSRLSQESGRSQSTAHTSLSVDQQPKADPGLQGEPSIQEEPRTQEEPSIQEKPNVQEPSIQRGNVTEQIPQAQLPTWTADPQDNVAAYQAALAAAAQQAAASGKFRRDSSPAPPADLTITSPTTTGSEHSDPHNENALDNYEDEDEDGGYTSAGLDDYELDDDAIIAEINASALANDTDGWYGQEFGFYSTPLPQHHVASALSEKNLFQYSHGGYFGPSGVNRTASGRVVSREPNLTPITERSEYSNRNSLMSLMPSNSNNAAPLQSPGLAQLAMMSDDDNMSLSALMRFRTKAWGGSQVSLTSSRDGSPYDRNGATSPLDHEYAHGRKNSAFSLFSQDSGAGSGSGSPTLTMSMSMPNIPTNSNPLSSISPNSNTSSATTTSPPPPSGINMATPLYSPPPPPSHSNNTLSSTACPPVFEDEETEDVVVVGQPAPRKKGLISKFNNSAASNSNSNSISNSNSNGGSNGSRKSSSTAAVLAANNEDGDDKNCGQTTTMTTDTDTDPSKKPKRPSMGHRHKGSADSISYMKEEDSGESRWVMERRRTDDSGEIEVLRREVINQGRI